MDNRPIGVFDSGLGGLTVVKEIKKILPNENIIYLGDTARVPYGTRSKSTIIRFAEEDIKFLLKFKVKCIVIACNSVSSVATQFLKKQTSIPIFDVISPTCYYLGKLRKYRKIGVIGTRATIKSNVYKDKIGKINSKIEVLEKEAPLLVSLIEEGLTRKKYTLEILDEYLKVFKQKKIEVIILACTHYPILLNLFKKILGKNVDLINPGKYLAFQLKEYLEKENLISNNMLKNSYVFNVTDLTKEFKKQVDIFFGKKIKSKLVKVSMTE